MTDVVHGQEATIRLIREAPVSGLRELGRATNAVAATARRVIVLALPARLRRVYVPPAYSAIDRAAVILFGLTCGILQAIGRFPVPQDARAYWSADLAHLYTTDLAHGSPYLYPPPLAQITTLLQPIGWQLFCVAWTTLLWVALAYMLGRWAWLFVAMGIVALAVSLPYELGCVLSPPPADEAPYSDWVTRLTSRATQQGSAELALHTHLPGDGRLARLVVVEVDQRAVCQVVAIDALVVVYNLRGTSGVRPTYDYDLVTGLIRLRHLDLCTVERLGALYRLERS